ncbi:DUF1573 domain-containing protein [Alkalicella caledoniensis]|uniref:DUF1573 domain-containing protein n=1 Tax=Alkalicella caledoniensis TaxID=2731377 RepID=A0A7G9W805_ALKCA|nr:DUF1573 domain-containing protein [Alkalicella caledoniensis]QNO14817.1 DUF1573 domain-containing protein [Alkalicella caledoniensis]
MKEINCEAFQGKVNDLLIRHRSILDVLSKYHESNSRVNRSVAKSVTNCGCLSINAAKEVDSLEMEPEEFYSSRETHLAGKLCDSCKEIIEMELGNNLFYFVALCNILDLDMEEILKKEYGKISALGKFNLT